MKTHVFFCVTNQLKVNNGHPWGIALLILSGPLNNLITEHKHDSFSPDKASYMHSSFGKKLECPSNNNDNIH